MIHFLKKTEVLTRLTLILFIIIISACGQATPPNANQMDKSSNITITFADMNFDVGVDFQALADEFHKQNPAITVTVIKQDHPAPLADADIAKQADVVYLPGSNPATLPGILPLQPLLEQAKDFNLNDLWLGSLTACSDAQGNPYGIPLTIFLQGIYYNPGLFDQAHVSYPQPGWTWDQFQALISQLGSITDNQTIYGFVDGLYGDILDPLLVQQLSANSSQVDAKGIANNLAWYVQLAKDKKLYPLQPAINGAYQTNQITNLQNLLKNNQAAMWISSPFVSGGNSQGGYLPYPVGQPTDHTTPASANCGAISSGTKSPQAAWAWLNFLSHQDLSGEQTSGLLPARQSLVEASPYYASLSEPERSALQYGLAHAWYYSQGLGDTLYTVEQAIANAIQSGTDLADALQTITSSARAQAQATATVTAQPVAINPPLATPTNLPENEKTITFDWERLPGAMVSYDATFEMLFDEVIKDFEKSYPEITVLTAAPIDAPTPLASDRGNEVRSLAKSYDCFLYIAPHMNSPYPQITPGDVLDLTPLLDADPALRDDFYPAFFTPFEMDGKLYGLPAGVMLEYIAYNANLLTRLGIRLPQAGWTLDDLVSIASQAADLSANPPIYGFWDRGYQVLFAQQIPYLDTSVQPPKATFTSDAVNKAFAWFKPLFQHGTLNLYSFSHVNEYDQTISQGQTALWVTNGFQNFNPDPNTALQNPLYEKDFAFKVGYAPFPLLASGEPMSMAYQMAGYYISGYTTQAKAHACWTWIQYLSSRPGIFGAYSPRKSVLPQESVGQDPEQFKVVQRIHPAV